jgi:hypothetical protein
MDEESVKLGLLMETAQTHQKLAEALIEKLKEHTQGLDAVVRDQLRRVFIEEFKDLQRDSARGGGPAESEAGSEPARDIVDTRYYRDRRGDRARRRLVGPAVAGGDCDFAYPARRAHE